MSCWFKLHLLWVEDVHETLPTHFHFLVFGHRHTRHLEEISLHQSISHLAHRVVPIQMSRYDECLLHGLLDPSSKHQQLCRIQWNHTHVTDLLWHLRTWKHLPTLVTLRIQYFNRLHELGLLVLGCRITAKSIQPSTCQETDTGCTFTFTQWWELLPLIGGSWVYFTSRRGDTISLTADHIHLLSVDIDNWAEAGSGHQHGLELLWFYFTFVYGDLGHRVYCVLLFGVCGSTNDVALVIGNLCTFRHV